MVPCPGARRDHLGPEPSIVASSQVPATAMPIAGIGGALAASRACIPASSAIPRALSPRLVVAAPRAEAEWGLPPRAA